MDKVMKESFFEATVKFNEEFDNADLAAKSKKPGDEAKIEVLDLKLEMSKIKQQLKEQDVRSQSDKSIKGSAIGGIKKDV